MNIAIITGASSGIGMEFALQMDKFFPKIDEFWLVARRQDKMEKLSENLKHKTRIFSMDITVEEQLERLENVVKKNQAVVRMLVNCSGYGLMGKFADLNRKDALGMIRLNCEALTSLTHRMIPYMKKGSRIIQLASSAAFLPQVNFAVYAATKSYVLSFSRALGEELREKEIYVTSVCPGPVDTPFFEFAESTGTTLKLKKYVMVNVEDVVKRALRDSYKKRTMSVYSIPIQAFAVATKLLPHEPYLRIMTELKKREK